MPFILFLEKNARLWGDGGDFLVEGRTIDIFICFLVFSLRLMFHQTFNAFFVADVVFVFEMILSRFCSGFLKFYYPKLER